MDIEWKGQVQIQRPIEQVFAYLADFQRHTEWAQTVVKLEQVHEGDRLGMGAVYRTYERQSLQSDRKPGEALLRGMEAKTLCEITEIIPNKRIAWHSHTLPKTGMYADWSFEFSAATDGGTLLIQRTHFHQPGLMALLFSLMFRGNLHAKSYAQFDASLKNIKTVLEEPPASAGFVPSQTAAATA
jgi:uncharacterized membrane protein